MEPWALFLDIDRTLTADDNVIPERNIKALREARKLGHKVFINTGRSYGNIPKKIFEQIEVDGVVSGNGNVLIMNDEILFSSFMDRDAVRKLADAIFANPQCWAVIEGLKRIYNVEERGSELPSDDNTIFSTEEFLEKSADDSIQTVAVSKDFPVEILESIKESVTWFTFSHYFDITSFGNNKAKGMLKALDAMGIPVERSMAFGDSDNDRQMLIDSGFGVAVANSQQEILEIADYITLSNKEGGVGAAVEKFLLKGDNHE